MPNILGINAYHADSAACLIKDAKLHFAIEEERIIRIKHWAGFPVESIKACLDSAKMELEDIDFIAFNSNPYKNLHKKIYYTLSQKLSSDFVKSRFSNTRARLNAASDFEDAFPGSEVKSKFKRVEHHLAHLASAYYASAFTESCVLSVDGFGDFASATWGVAKGNKIDVDGQVNYPHSLGIFYQAITQYLGFSHYGDEYKVMGMAAYGSPVYVEQLQKLCRYQGDGKYVLDLDYFLHHTDQSSYSIESGQPQASNFYSDLLVDLLGPSRQVEEPITQFHQDIACSAQIIYERAFFNLCHRLYEKYQIDNLSLAGGCAMNSLANGKIKQQTPFKQIYIPAAAGDAGGAVGAAYLVAIQNGVNANSLNMPDAYIGSEYSMVEYLQIIDDYRDQVSAQGCEVRQLDDNKKLCLEIATAISKGKVIGWFQGKMEWGPRALGNRSILGDPRRADMQNILNLKIKRRESFRPFAPSILREQVSDWFERDDDVAFMAQVFMINKAQREKIPAVTHADGSGRLQTVTKQSNPLYYQLIETFYTLTGVPILLNTSFNENEPIVSHPSHAIECFLRTKMDCLVLGDFVITRNEMLKP